MKKGRKTARFITSFLMVLMLIIALPMNSYAEDKVHWHEDDEGNQDYPDRITIPPYVYEMSTKYDKELDGDNLRTLAGDVLSNWSSLAYRTFLWGRNEGGTYSGITSNIPYNSDWSDYFLRNSDDGSSIDLEYWLSDMNEDSVGETRNDYGHRTGLRTTTSLKQLRSAMDSELRRSLGENYFDAGVFLEKGGGGTDGALHELNDEKETKVFYNIVTKLINPGVTEDYFYNSYGIAVYDFELSPIIDPDVGYKDAVTTDDPNSQNAEKKFISYSENKSRQPGNVTMELSDSQTQTVTNSITNTESLSFTEGVTNNFQWGISSEFFSDVLSVSVSSTEAMATAYESGKSVSQTVENKLSASTDLPAHTGVEMIQTTGEKNKIVNYTCPVSLRYKVAIFSMSGHAFSDKTTNRISGTTTNFSTVFGCGKEDGGYGAPENLYNRVVSSIKWDGDGKFVSYDPSCDDSYGNVHGWYEDSEIRNGVDWGWVLREGTKEFRDKVTDNATIIPLFGQGASLKVSTYGESSEIGEIRPLYQLTQVKLEEGEDYYEMVSGDTMTINGFTVQGYNEENIPFYGFKPDKGNWILCDASGNKLDSSDVASLDVNPSTGRMILTAKDPGEVYLKWVLSDDVEYTSIYGKDEVVSATENVPTYPSIQIKVKERPVDLSGYRIELKTNAEMKLGETLELNTELSPAVYDDDDIIITNVVKYEPQDQSGTTDFSLSEDGEFIPAKAGTYKVRAFYGVGRSRITSDWVTILVKPAPALTYMTVNDPDVTTITTTTPEQSFDLASYVSYFDQYDVPWTEAVTPEFTLPEGTKNASIDNGILKVTAPGKYPVTVSVDGIESKVINVIVNGPTGVVISDEADVLATRISGDADDVDLSKLTIKAVDLDSADWDLSQSEVVWYVDDVALTGTDYTAPANTDENDKVHTVKAGVKSGTEEIFSNELTLTIKQARKLASLTISGDFTEDGLGIGDGYAIVFDKDIVIDARDQYDDVIDPGTDLEWTSGTKYAKVTNNESLVGIAEGDGQLTVTGAGGTVVSNTLEFRVWLKPYVAEIYADDGGTITEEEEFDLRKVTITAKDQNERAYNMTQKEIDSIDWSITDKGTIKSSDGVVYDKDEGTIKVPEGVLDYGATGTVVVTGTFTNPNGKSATGSFTISVEQKPILDSMTLGLIDEESEIETEVVKFCMSYFKVTGTDQYDRDFDMTDVPLTFVSSNEDAFKIGDADDKAISTITAGTPNTDSEITVETTNYLNVKVVSNILEMHVPRVRKLTSLEMTTVPEAIHVNTDFDMKDLGAVCFDEIHEPYSEEDLDAYPAKITYSLDKGATTATLDTAKNILTTGNKRGKITVSANAVNTSTTRIIEDEDEDAIEVGVDIWVGPIIEKIEASTDKFHVDGGNLEVTFTGKVLDDGIVVDLIDKDGNIIQTVESSGTETAQKAVLKVPANKSLTEDKEYTISYSVCGDAEGTDEYTPKSDVKVIVESHKLVKIARVEATCEVNGNIEYWQCSVCKKLFADSEAKKEITEADTVIPAIGHDWSYGKISRRAKDTKSGIITCTCRNDSTHKKNVNVEPILVKLTPSTGKSMTISWTKEALADGYDIYFSQCNSANKKIPCKFVKTVKKGKALKLKMKNLEKGFCYKSYVKAYRMVKGKKQYIAESYEVHSLSTKSYGKRTNAKNVKLKSKSVTLHKGDTFKIKGVKITPAVKSKKLVIHGKKFRYVSSDSSIATVSDKGKIKAVSSGECKIYVVSSNGVYSAITVEVEE